MTFYQLIFSYSINYSSRSICIFRRSGPIACCSGHRVASSWFSHLPCQALEATVSQAWVASSCSILLEIRSRQLARQVHNVRFQLFVVIQISELQVNFLKLFCKLMQWNLNFFINWDIWHGALRQCQWIWNIVS